MKNIRSFLFALVLGFAFACQNESTIVENELIEPIENLDSVQKVIPLAIDTVADEEFPAIDEPSITDWKTNAKYDHFIATTLDTVYIGPSREIIDPFEYFNEKRSNVFVIIDSGRYVNDSGIWLQGENIIIKGTNGVSLLIDVLYDNVMWVVGENIVVDNLHMMHLMPGELEGQNCSGRVIGFDGADNVTIVNCDLNGCGLAGLHDNLGNGTIYIEHNYIHNNSLGAYTNIDGEVWQEEVTDHETFVFKNNRLEDNGFGYDPTDAYLEEDFHGDH